MIVFKIHINEYKNYFSVQQFLNMPSRHNPVLLHKLLLSSHKETINRKQQSIYDFNKER